jgi:hypothetical protein
MPGGSVCCHAKAKIQGMRKASAQQLLALKVHMPPAKRF